MWLFQKYVDFAQVAKEQARKYLRAKQSFIWNATNLTEQMRSKLISLFEDYEEKERRQKEEEASLEKERKMQDALVDIKHKYGKNAILKGMNFKEGATAKDRNRQIGGHKA